MLKTKLLFNSLINALDIFLDKEEKEIGCLTEEEHSEIIKMRNRINDILMRKLYNSYPKKETHKQNEQLIYIPYFDEENDDIARYKKKNSHEIEL